MDLEQIKQLANYIDDNGYIKSYIPDHPYENHCYVPEHRLVAEYHVGFPLPPDIVVHHIDFNKQHNVWENLFITTAPEHVAIHNRYQTHSLARRKRIRDSLREKNKKSKNRDELRQ